MCIRDRRRGVHVLVGLLHVRVGGPDPFDGAPPEVAGGREHVVLVHEGEMLALASAGLLEGVAHHALHPEPGVDAGFDGHLGGGADAQRSPVAGVGALGALPDHDEVDARRGDLGDVQRAPHPEDCLLYTSAPPWPRLRRRTCSGRSSSSTTP